MNKARLEAFSDGIFGFAATLLILGITLPELTHKPPSDVELAHAMLGMWPQLLTYLMSFAVIGIMWQNHHALFRLVARVDRTTTLLNLALLAVTVFIPFATSMLGAYPDMRSTTFLFGLTLTSASTAYNMLLMHLVRGGSFSGHVTKSTIHSTLVAYRVGWITYAIATALSLDRSAQWVPRKVVGTLVSLIQVLNYLLK